MHTLEESGVGERCFRGQGELGLVGRDFRYLLREHDREELLLLLLSLLDDLERDLFLALAVPLASFPKGDEFLGGFAEVGDNFFADFESTGFLFLGLSLLEAELLREELPDELDRLEPEELE